jgi:hypothetical protein
MPHQMHSLASSSSSMFHGNFLALIIAGGTCLAFIVSLILTIRVFRRPAVATPSAGGGYLMGNNQNSPQPGIPANGQQAGQVSPPVGPPAPQPTPPPAGAFIDSGNAQRGPALTPYDPAAVPVTPVAGNGGQVYNSPASGPGSTQGAIDEYKKRLEQTKAELQQALDKVAWYEVEYPKLRKAHMEMTRLQSDLAAAQAALATAQAAQTKAQNDLALERSARERAERYYADLQKRVQSGGKSPPLPETEPKDPPNFEKEEKYHPHTKAVPKSGPAITLGATWHIVGGSVRGRSHLNGKYRDDEFAVHMIGDKAALIAIADGVGSKELSRWGAYMAVTDAGKPINEHRRLHDLVNLVQQGTESEDGIRPLAVNFMLDVLKAASNGVKAYAKEYRLNQDDLHSTFLAYLAVPRPDASLFVASAQIGDGALILRTRAAQEGDAPEWQFLQEPQFTGVDSKVVPFLRFNEKNWTNIIKTHTIEPGCVLLGMTDGTVDDISTQMDEDTGHFNGYEDFLAKVWKESITSQHPGPGMVKFLEYRKRGSGDDRTIVCIY